jgi:hypothetical protein
VGPRQEKLFQRRGVRMKNLLPWIVLFSVSEAVLCDVPKVIYGNDDRVARMSSENDLYKELAKSTAAMVNNDRLEIKKDGPSQGQEFYQVLGKTFQEEMFVCAEERFSEVIAAVSCSGFLVDEDLLVTAGHCIVNMDDCSKNKWVFDYTMESVGGEKKSIPTENVYGCKEIISRSLDNGSMNDYALIRLDRAVTDRNPLAFRDSGKISDDAKLVVIGHPSGLPSIITDQASVRTNDNAFYFQANLDTYGGNSGSAVFNAEDGVVEGILVRGERDYIFDEVAGCFRSNKCDENGCRGEDVTRITVVPELAPGMTPVAPVVVEEEAPVEEAPSEDEGEAPLSTPVLGDGEVLPWISVGNTVVDF